MIQVWPDGPWIDPAEVAMVDAVTRSSWSRQQPWAAGEPMIAMTLTLRSGEKVYRRLGTIEEAGAERDRIGAMVAAARRAVPAAG